MNQTESAKLLWYVSLGDRYDRGQDEEHWHHWHEVLGHLDFADARAAILWWRQNSSDDPTPADIIRRAGILAADRRRAQERLADGPAALQRTSEQQAYIEAQRARIRPIVDEARELAAPRWRDLGVTTLRALPTGAEDDEGATPDEPPAPPPHTREQQSAATA